MKKSDPNHKEIITLAQKMFDDFIGPGAMQPLNAPGRCVKEVKKALEDDQFDSATIFKRTMTEISKLLVQGHLKSYVEYKRTSIERRRSEASIEVSVCRGEGWG